MRRARPAPARGRLLPNGGRLAAVGLLLLLHPASPAAQRRGPAADARAPAAREGMLVTTGWLAARLGDPKVFVLHVARERAHYERGHVPGARFVAWGEITATRGGVPNELPPAADLKRLFERLGVGDEGRVVLYGDGAGLSAARAYFTLDYLGHGARAALLDGGLEKWRAEGRAVSTAPVEPTPAPFTPRLRAGVVTELDVVRDLSWAATSLPTPDAVLIDARPAEEYAGTKPGEGVARGGHIPGAANVFWMRNVVSAENPVMRPAAELRRLYEAAGAAPGRQLVTYCRTGGQASHSYFTLKYLGYDVVMYDGSFFEWSNAKDTPVATPPPAQQSPPADVRN
jgi:thiosulfate/3-mercaptopyruvate sulfurtransferase